MYTGLNNYSLTALRSKFETSIAAQLIKQTLLPMAFRVTATDRTMDKSVPHIRCAILQLIDNTVNRTKLSYRVLLSYNSV
jgi:ribosomal protein L10